MHPCDVRTSSHQHIHTFTHVPAQDVIRASQRRPFAAAARCSCRRPGKETIALTVLPIIRKSMFFMGSCRAQCEMWERVRICTVLFGILLVLPAVQSAAEPKRCDSGTPADQAGRLAKKHLDLGCVSKCACVCVCVCARAHRMDASKLTTHHSDV